MTHHQIIANSRRSLLIFAQRHGITKACKLFGVSRTTFYNVKKQFIETGSLEPRIRRKPRMPNETSLSRKKLLLKLVQQHPSWGQNQYAYEFRKYGISISSAGVWYCLNRFGLTTRYKRLLYIEALRQEHQPLTERHIRHIKRTHETIKHGLWPGHIVALDTFYVGNLKGVGRMYQMTGIDICSRFGWAHLYLTKEQTSSMNFVEEVLLPKFFNNNVTLETVLTDNGTEFTGHKFQQLLLDYDVRHYRIPAGKPLLNGYCERFQRTIYEELYQLIFRKQYFSNLTKLNQKLQEYLAYYNFERAHFGLDKKGCIPIDAFKSKNSFLRRRFQKLSI